MFPLFVPALLASSWRTTLIVMGASIVGGAQLSRLADAFSYLLPQSATDASSIYFSLWFPRQLPSFIFGIMLFKWSARHPLINPAVAAIFCALSIGMMMLVPFLQDIKYALPLGLQTTYGIIFSLFIFSLMSWESSPLINTITIWIGKISYSAYFVHFGFLHLFTAPHPSGSACIDFLFAYLAIVVATVALSSATYLFVEQPMIKLGNKMISGHLISKTVHA